MPRKKREGPLPAPPYTKEVLEKLGFEDLRQIARKVVFAAARSKTWIAFARKDQLRAAILSGKQPEGTDKKDMSWLERNLRQMVQEEVQREIQKQKKGKGHDTSHHN